MEVTLEDETPPQGLQMDFLVDFLELLNREIPPAKAKSPLRLPHSINYVKPGTIEVNLYPANGGSYHIPVKVAGKSAQEVVGEVRRLFDKISLIS